MSPRRRRHRRGTSRQQCRNPECRAEVKFFTDWTGRRRVVNARPVDGREQHRLAYPEWGGRLWETAEDLAAELASLRTVDTDPLQEALDLPWYQLHHCEINQAIAEAVQEASTP